MTLPVIGLVATYALGHMMWCCTLLGPIQQRVLNHQSEEHSITGQNLNDLLHSKCSSALVTLFSFILHSSFIQPFECYVSLMTN